MKKIDTTKAQHCCGDLHIYPMVIIIPAAVLLILSEYAGMPVTTIIAFFAVNLVAWFVGRLLHELTHYAVAWLAGAENIGFAGRPLGAWFTVWSTESQRTARLIGLSPRLIGITLLIWYVGTQPLTIASTPVLMFFLGYALMGGLSDFSVKRSKKRLEEIQNARQ